LRSRIFVIFLIVQAIFCALHFFLYKSLVDLVWPPAPESAWKLQLAFAILSFWFVGASALAFYVNNIFVRVFYTLAAIWTGLGSFLIWASCVSWIVAGIERGTTIPLHAHRVAQALFAAAALATVYGMINAALPRIRRVKVELANLPASWRGRTAALVADTHLGHVRNLGFARRIVRAIQRENPGAVFIAGDMYDGTRADLPRLASPWSELKVPHGIYFVDGNHEEFRSNDEYLEAVRSARIRVLNNEKVVVDGLQIVGVHYHATVDAAIFRGVLANAAIDRNTASVLISHAPHRLNIPEQAGISLQVSGHTHGGQFFPYTWITSRIFGKFVHGLHRLGTLQVLTSYGAGTWGPPIRVGTTPEIIVIEFV
jgi:uncharacterized protein